MPLRWRTSPIVDLSSASPSRTAGADRHALLAVRREEEHRQDEDEIPDRRQRSGGASVLAELRVEPEDRIDADDRLAGLRRTGHEGDDEDQHDHAAEIAEPPGDVGDPADIRLGDQARHHRIVEDGRELRRDRGQREEAATTQNRLEPGAANHSRQRLTILIAAKKPIQGLRGPVWSAIEPSTGERMAMTKPAAAMP